jgi:hypothetical protein
MIAARPTVASPGAARGSRFSGITSLRYFDAGGFL